MGPASDSKRCGRSDQSSSPSVSLSESELEFELEFEFESELELLFESELEFELEFEFESELELLFEFEFESSLEFEDELEFELLSDPSISIISFFQNGILSSSAKAGAAKEAAMKVTVATLAMVFIGWFLRCLKQSSLTAQG